MKDILAVLRGYNPPDRCFDKGEAVISGHIHQAADAIAALRAENARLIQANEAWHLRVESLKCQVESEGERAERAEAKVTALTERSKLDPLSHAWKSGYAQAVEERTAEVAALKRVVAAADAMHEAWYDGKDGEVARLMRDYDAPRAALKASD